MVQCHFNTRIEIGRGIVRQNGVRENARGIDLAVFSVFSRLGPQIQTKSVILSYCCESAAFTGVRSGEGRPLL